MVVMGILHSNLNYPPQFDTGIDKTVHLCNKVFDSWYVKHVILMTQCVIHDVYMICRSVTWPHPLLHFRLLSAFVLSDFCWFSVQSIELFYVFILMARSKLILLYQIYWSTIEVALFSNQYPASQSLIATKVYLGVLVDHLSYKES